jgi:hypothetical protein
VLQFELILTPRLLAVLSLHRSLELFLVLLDSSKQCQGQPALWGQPWFGHGYSHLRLGSNYLRRLPFCHPLVGYGQYRHYHRIFLLVHHTHSLCKTELLLPFTFFSISEQRFSGTPTSGTALTFPWCPQTLSITRGSNITSPRSSIPIPPSTSRLTRHTAPSSFPYRSPYTTASRFQPSLPPLHILSSITANIYGLMLVAHSPNNLISIPA